MRQKNDSSSAYLILTLFVLVTVTCMSACKGGSGQSGTIHEGVIRIGYQNNVASAPIILADRMKIFQKLDLKVEAIPFPSGKLAYNALLAGEVDFCTVSEIPVLTHGPSVGAKVISCTAESRRPAWITARKDAGIEAPADLRGKRIGTQRNSAVHFFLSTFLKEYDIGDSECEVVFYAAKELPEALANGEIDAFSMRDPFATEARQLVGTEGIVEFDSTLYLQHFLFVVSADFLEQTTDVVAEVLKAVILTEETLSDPAVAAKLISPQYPDKPLAELEAALNAYIYKIRLDDALLVTWDYESRWWGSQGIEIDPDIHEVIDTTVLTSVDPLRNKIRN